MTGPLQGACGVCLQSGHQVMIRRSDRGNAMSKRILLSTILVVNATLGLAVLSAQAQQPTVPPVQKTQPVTPPPAAAPATKTPVKKATSVCQGLEEKACRTNTECTWIAATTRKDGKEVKAYCRKKSGPTAKAGASPKAAKANPAPATSAPPPKPTPPASTTPPGTAAPAKK